jgi:lipid-A-disaccharide synthase
LEVGTHSGGWVSQGSRERQWFAVYNTGVRILIAAGEASGEMYGAQLMEALRQDAAGDARSVQLGGAPQAVADASVHATQELEFFGVGGEKMRAAECEIIVEAKDLAVVGITEILGHLPKIWRLFHKLIREVDRRKPDLAIVIDSPAFNWRVARELKKRGVPVIYYVCPQFWAWRQGRVRLLRKYVDKALVIFPFEEKFYCDRGVNAEFVGHPLAALPRPAILRQAYADKFGVSPEKQWITLMPGSRVKEVRMNLPGMLEAAQRLGLVYEFLIPVAPMLDQGFVRALLAGPSAESIHLVPEALPALAHSRAGIIASGTATVEAAMMNLPFVMVYRVTPMTYWLGRATVKCPYFAMVNLIAGEKVVPELVQEDFTPEKVAEEIGKLIPEGQARQAMLNGLEKVRRLLAKDDAQAGLPAARAAKAIFRVSRE